MKSKKKTEFLLKEYIKNIVLENKNVKRLRIFDFDHTLVVTDANIWVTNIKGERFPLSANEYANYEKQPGDVFDYSEFLELKNPVAIAWINRILRNVYDKYGPDGVAVLSARTSSKPIHEFLNKIGLKGIEVVALGNTDPMLKVNCINEWIEQRDLKYVEFYDDSPKNIDAVKQLRLLHPDVKIIVRHVIHTKIPTHGFSKNYGS